jgi:transposase
MRRTEALQGVRMIKFLDILGRYEALEFNQLEAAELLGVGERTFRRWCQRYEEDGEAGLLESGSMSEVSGQFREVRFAPQQRTCRDCLGMFERCQIQTWQIRWIIASAAAR